MTTFVNRWATFGTFDTVTTTRTRGGTEQVRQDDQGSERAPVVSDPESAGGSPDTRSCNSDSVKGDKSPAGNTTEPCAGTDRSPAPTIPRTFPAKGVVILAAPEAFTAWAKSQGYPRAGMMRTADGELFITTDVVRGLRAGVYDVLAVPR